MKLTPQDILHQEFKRIMRGFDPEEVTAFLEVVSENYKEILDESKLLTQKIKSLQDEAQYLRLRIQDNEKNIKEYKSEITNVEKLVDARVDADLIIEKANAEATKIRDEAKKQGESVAQELNFLHLQKSKVAEHLREYLRSQMALLEIVEETKLPTVPEKDSDSKQAEKKTETIAPKKIVPEPEIKQHEIQSYLAGVEVDDVDLDVESSEKKKKALDELDKLTHNATGIFKKSDFQKMLGDDVHKKSEDMIDQMHEELKKKKSENE